MNFRNLRAYNYFFIFLAFFIFSCKQQKAVDPAQNQRATKQQLIEINRILVTKDKQRIKGYIERQKLEMQETETGLWYSVVAEGEGPRAETGMRVTINYRLSLLDGTECYNSEEEGAKTFTIGRGGVESGLEEGILLMNEGGKANFIMPPYLAHGLPGDGDRIPARAIIVYEVELVSID